MRHIALAAVALSVLAGCGAPPPKTDNVIDETSKLLPPPKNGIQLVMPKEEIIKAGGDQMWCWVPEVPAGTTDSDHLVTIASGAQGGGGHHLFVFMAAIPRKTGDVFDCTQVEEMVTLRPLIAPLSPTSPTFGKVLPEGYAIRMPAGAQLVVQSHYVNIKTEAIKIRDVVNLEFADDATTVKEAAYWTETSTGFSIPTGEHKVTDNCTMHGDLTVLSVLGHMHEWGKKFTFNVTPAGGTAPTTPTYAVDDWTAQYRDSPPLTLYPDNQPLVLHDGDVLTMTCEWNNDTGGDLTFPHEMCTTFGAYSPVRPEGFFSCDPAETVTF
jgi:hypothetical protein